MRTPVQSSLNRFVDDGGRKYKSGRGLIVAYSTVSKKANIQLLGSIGGVITNIPVSIPCQASIKVNQTAIVIFTEESNPASAIICGLL